MSSYLINSLIMIISVFGIMKFVQAIDSSDNLDYTNLISNVYLNKSNNVKIEENSTIKFDCQSNELGCGIVFNDLKIIDNHIMELSIKLKNSDLYDDLTNGLAIWYIVFIIRFLSNYDENVNETSNHFLGYHQKFMGTLLKITDKNSKLVLFQNKGEQISKSTVYYDKTLNQSDNKAKGIKFCDLIIKNERLNLRIMLLKTSLVFQVLSNNSWKYCFSSQFENLHNLTFSLSSRMFKERFYYELDNLKLSKFNISSNFEKKIKLPSIIPINNSSNLDFHYKTRYYYYLIRVTHKIENLNNIIKHLSDKNKDNSDVSEISNLKSKIEEAINKLEKSNLKIISMNSDLEKFSNISMNEDNVLSLDQKEANSILIETMKNLTEEIKTFVDNINLGNRESDEKVNLLNMINNIIKSHQSINNSIETIESSIKYTLSKIHKKSKNVKNNDINQYLILFLVLYIFFYSIYIYFKFSESNVVAKKINPEKIFDSIV